MLFILYQAILSLAPDVNPLYKSGGDTLLRPVSRGTQTYDTDKSVWPLNQPVPKLEALAQVINISVLFLLIFYLRGLWWKTYPCDPCQSF